MPRMGYFLFMLVPQVWTKRSQSMIAGFGASVDENEPFLAKFESYVANGAHRANANMGMYSPVIRPINKSRVCGIFYFGRFGISR